MPPAAKASAADTSKNLVANVKKHHFWLLLGVVVITSVVVWYLSTSALQAAFNNNSRDIKNKFGEIERLPSNPLRNDKMISEIKAEQDKIRNQAVAAWKVHRERQQPLLVWPKEFAAIEANLQTPGYEIPEALRRDFLQTLLLPAWQQLFLIPQPVLDPTQTVLPVPDGYRGLVTWTAPNMVDYLNRHKQDDVPSDIRVRTAVEDMWIYKNLFEIIRGMNEGAGDRLQATIKRVRALEIAQWAIAEAQRYPGPEIADAGGNRGVGGGVSRTIALPVAKGTKFEDSAIMNGRYVDGDNRPIPFSKGAAQPFSEFRQMFVLMRFVMDQRAIPQLLARCANAPFPIVARQVLVKFQDVDTLERSDGFDPGALLGSPDDPIGPNDALVEVRGLIFLYESPNAEKLGTGTAAQPAKRKLGIPQKEAGPPQ